MSAPFVPLNPKPFLNSLTGKKVSVVLKWNMTYEGILEAVDSYMNLKVQTPYLIATDQRETHRRASSQTQKNLSVANHRAF